MDALSGTAIRAELLRALEADLVGPFYPADSSPREELLPIEPSRWYLTGFLAPQADRETLDPTADEEFGTGTDDEEENEAGLEPEPKQKNNYPASMGLSVLLPPPSAEQGTIRVTVSFAEYVREDLTVVLEAVAAARSADAEVAVAFA